MKLKYECPAPSRLTKENPLWKVATTNFLRIVRECGNQIQYLGDGKDSYLRIICSLSNLLLFLKPPYRNVSKEYGDKSLNRSGVQF